MSPQSHGIGDKHVLAWNVDEFNCFLFKNQCPNRYNNPHAENPILIPTRELICYSTKEALP